MNAAGMHRFEIKVMRLPVWTLLVPITVAVVLLALAGIIGIGLLLLVSPIVLVAAAAHRLRGRRATEPTIRPRSRTDSQSRPRTPPVIEGEYQVIDERPARPVPPPDADKR